MKYKSDWVERCKRYVNASMHNGLIDVGHCLKVIIYFITPISYIYKSNPNPTKSERLGYKIEFRLSIPSHMIRLNL